MLIDPSEEQLVAIPKAMQAMTDFVKTNPIAVSRAIYAAEGYAGLMVAGVQYGGAALAVGMASYTLATLANDLTNHWASDRLELGLEYILGNPSLPQDDLSQSMDDLMMSDICSNWSDYWYDGPVYDCGTDWGY